MGSKVDEVSSTLLRLSELIQSSVANYVAFKTSPGNDTDAKLPAKALFDCQRTLLAAAGMLTELVSDPRSRLLEIGLQYFEARALHIVADKRIADILQANGDAGVDVKTLSTQTGIECGKLCMLKFLNSSFLLYISVNNVIL